jgi:hypothetical protein
VTQEAAMDRKQDKAKDELDKELEEGLEDTFPASDPPTATQPVHHEKPQKKRH